MSTDPNLARIADALERIAKALERPVQLDPGHATLKALSNTMLRYTMERAARSPSPRSPSPLVGGSLQGPDA